MAALGADGNDALGCRRCDSVEARPFAMVVSISVWDNASRLILGASYGGLIQTMVDPGSFLGDARQNSSSATFRCYLEADETTVVHGYSIGLGLESKQPAALGAANSTFSLGG